MLLDIVKVQVGNDAVLLLEFETGEQRCFDMTPLLDQKPWLHIKPAHLFSRAFVANGTVTWPENIDIAPETLYDLSVPMEPWQS
jgi:hypothetical protein